jgi:hypothetical protein
VKLVRYAEAFATRALGWIFARGDAARAMRSSASDTLKIVYAYAAALSQPRAKVTDESRLPYPKPQIKTALVTAMGLATQESMREELRNAYLRLADWQDLSAGEAATTTTVAHRVDAEIRQLNDELKELGLQVLDS